MLSLNIVKILSQSLKFGLSGPCLKISFPGAGEQVRALVALTLGLVPINTL